MNLIAVVLEYIPDMYSSGIGLLDRCGSDIGVPDRRGIGIDVPGWWSSGTGVPDRCNISIGVPGWCSIEWSVGVLTLVMGLLTFEGC